MEVNPNPNFVNLNLSSREITPKGNDKKNGAITFLAMSFILPYSTGSSLSGRVTLDNEVKEA